MSKFSDSNYELLSTYLDAVRTISSGNNSAYVIGPKKSLMSEGGYITLYENSPTKGYVGHNFSITEIDGNRFKMQYQGLESTFSIATSAFDIGNEFYFRKDSEFHAWLARTSNEEYRNYCNTEKTFLYFGKIWPSPGTNSYVIEFEGM